jgi:hypothetical protein
VRGDTLNTIPDYFKRDGESKEEERRCWQGVLWLSSSLRESSTPLPSLQRRWRTERGGFGSGSKLWQSSTPLYFSLLIATTTIMIFKAIKALSQAAKLFTLITFKASR